MVALAPPPEVAKVIMTQKSSLVSLFDFWPLNSLLNTTNPTTQLGGSRDAMGIAGSSAPSVSNFSGAAAVPISPTTFSSPVTPRTSSGSVTFGKLLGTVVLNNITNAFTALDNDIKRYNGSISIPLFIAAGRSTIDLYQFIFMRENMFSNQLSNTTRRHVTCLDAHYSRLSTQATMDPESSKATESVQALLQYERSQRGVEAVKKDRMSACHTALWLNRGFMFLENFLTLLEDPVAKRTPRKCAFEAYDRTLGLYHSWMLRTGVHAVLRFVTNDRNNFFEKFGWDSEEIAVYELEKCRKAMAPVTKHVDQFMYNEGLNFKDQISRNLQ